MLLTEERASELVAEWTKDCAWIAPVQPTTTTRFTHTRVGVAGDFSGETIEDVKASALRLRVAMKGLNALTGCGGFDPEENSLFWRRQLRQVTGSRSAWRRLSSDLFSRFQVSYVLSTTVASCRVAFALATCLAMDPSSPGMDVRRRVLERLQGVLLTQPPPLDMAVAPSTSHTVLRDLARFQEHLYPTAPRIKVVIGSPGARCCLLPGIDVQSDIEKTLERKQLAVIEFYGMFKQQKMLFPRFHAVIDVLCFTDTVEVLSLKLDDFPTHDATRFCSALAHMRSLTSLQLDQTSFGSATAYEWLAFALRRRHLLGLPLALGTAFDPLRSDAFVRAMRHEATFRCFIPADLRGMLPFAYFPLGTTAKAANGATMTQEWLMGKAHLKWNGRRVDVLASAGPKSIVVVPAHGLIWIQSDALSGWQDPPCNVPRSLPPVQHTLILVDFPSSDDRLDVGDMNWQVVAVSVDRLRGSLTTEDLEMLFTRRSSLRSLAIPGCAMSTLAPLLTQPSGDWAIETLAVGVLRPQANDGSPIPLFQALTQSSNPIHHVLRELSIESLDVSMADMQTLAAVLGRHRRLQFLQLGSSASDAAWGPKVLDALAIALGPTERSKVWLYAFLLCARHSPRWHRLPCACKRLVVEFAAVQARRQVVFLPVGQLICDVWLSRNDSF